MEQKVYDNLLRKSTRTHELKIKGFCKKFVPYTSPHKSMISTERKKVCKHPTLKELATLFSALHLTQQQQRSRPRKTICPLRDLVQDWSIPVFIMTPVIPKLHINLSQTVHTNNYTCKRLKISEKNAPWDTTSSYNLSFSVSKCPRQKLNVSISNTFLNWKNNFSTFECF